jgi:hypothetical protein
MTAPRIFLLSPAHCGGKRAAILLNERATFPLAQRLRSAGLTLGEAFSFLSGLYFRGKITYAGRFARPPAGLSGVQVITTDRGLVPADATVGVSDLRAFGAVEQQTIRPTASLFSAILPSSNSFPTPRWSCSAASRATSTLTCFLRCLGTGCSFPARLWGGAI